MEQQIFPLLATTQKGDGTVLLQNHLDDFGLEKLLVPPSVASAPTPKPAAPAVPDAAAAPTPAPVAAAPQVYATAGTIFHKSRVPLRKWFWAIYLMATSKKGVSMRYLQNQLELGSYHTAGSMGHKIRQAMIQRDSLYNWAALLKQMKSS